MLYVVSGFMRCGTSMMMEALEAGGLEAVYSLARNAEMNGRWGDADYVPNRNYYELSSEDYLKGNLQHLHDGKLVKCLWGGAMRLPPGEYRLVFMRRPVMEIRASLMAFFGDDRALRGLGDFDAMMDSAIDILRDRRSFKTVDVVQYHDMLDRPAETLAALNWPIDVAKAAAIPNRNVARYTLARA